MLLDVLPYVLTGTMPHSDPETQLLVLLYVLLDMLHDMLPYVLIGTMPLADLETQQRALLYVLLNVPLNVMLDVLPYVLIGIMPPSGPRDTATCRVGKKPAFIEKIQTGGLNWI